MLLEANKNELSTFLNTKSVLRNFVVFLILLQMVSAVSVSWAGVGAFTNNNANTTGFKTKVCPALVGCQASAEAAKNARDQYAKSHSCYFLEDECTKSKVEDDKVGATSSADTSFWGQLANAVTTTIKYGYEFSKGLFAGLKDQLSDIIDLISSPIEVANGLYELAKDFYNDFKGTLQVLGTLLGDEAVKTIARATECGPYDLGKVIGENINPAVMLKLASKLAKYTGKLEDAVKLLKKEVGCASFTAGTQVKTLQGSVFIEQITIGNHVDSRNEKTWVQKPQLVTNVFGRTAPSYRALTTEIETIYLTDEHPLWIQGKGWIKAQEIKEDDVISAQNGDVLVQSNIAIAKPVQVYNFSVATTPSYFVGQAGLWAHNAKCDLIPGGSLSAHEGKGHTLERHVNVTASDIADRANSRGKYAGQNPPSMSSRYKNRETAEFVIARTIGERKAAIDAWLKDPTQTLPKGFESIKPFGAAIGEGVPKGSETTQELKKAVVVLKKDSSVTEGYIILTSYPIPE